MSRQTLSKLSRRDAILYGFGAAAVTCSNSTFAAHRTDEKIMVTGAIKGRTGQFAIDPQSGAIFRVSESIKVSAEAGLAQTRLPSRYLFEDQSPNGSLLVRESVDGRYRLCVCNSDGRRQRTIRTRGSVPEAKFSADGSQIAVIEFEEGTSRLVLMNANGQRQRIAAEETESRFRGVCWSPGGRHVGVVVFDWERLSEFASYPAPKSHRINIYAADSSGRPVSTVVAQADWLDRVNWTRS